RATPTAILTKQSHVAAYVLRPATREQVLSRAGWRHQACGVARMYVTAFVDDPVHIAVELVSPFNRTRGNNAYPSRYFSALPSRPMGAAGRSPIGAIASPVTPALA